MSKISDEFQIQPVGWLLHWLDGDFFYAFSQNKTRIEKLVKDGLHKAVPLYTYAEGIKNHAGQKLLVQHILDNDKGLSESSRVILEKLIEE